MSENVKRLRRQRHEVDRHGHVVSVAKPRTYEDGVADATEVAIAFVVGKGYAAVGMGTGIGEAIKAACLPPTEPEVVVTEEMKQAGADAFQLTEEGAGGVRLGTVCAAIYRAMQAAAPKQDSTRGGEPR